MNFNIFKIYKLLLINLLIKIIKNNYEKNINYL